MGVEDSSTCQGRKMVERIVTGNGSMSRHTAWDAETSDRDLREVGAGNIQVGSVSRRERR